METLHTSLREADAWAALDTVMDPEIPVISVVDLGIAHVVHADAQRVEVQLTPTFAGCPALDLMKAGMKEALMLKGFTQVEVKVNYQNPWSSNMISEQGKKRLKEFGISPPPAFDGMLTLDVLQNAVCPRCGSNHTTLKNTFGPTACRAMHFCHNCLETFEQFKPL